MKYRIDQCVLISILDNKEVEVIVKSITSKDNGKVKKIIYICEPISESLKQYGSYEVEEEDITTYHEKLQLRSKVMAKLESIAKLSIAWRLMETDTLLEILDKLIYEHNKICDANPLSKDLKRIHFDRNF